MAIGERVVLTGQVDSEARRTALLAAARAEHGDIVDDQLSVAANTSGQLLTVTGTVADQAAKDKISGAYRLADLELNDQLGVTPASVNELQALLQLKNIEFISNQSTFTANGQAVADEVAAILTRDTTTRFEVSGHTDSRGDAALNQALSQARADAVVAYLASKGIDATRFIAKGYGADRPVADNATTEGRQRNRRIEFVQAGG